MIRYFTIGSSAYPDIAIKNTPAGRVPATLIRSLNKKGKIENFKGDGIKTFKEMYAKPKFPAVFVIGLWRDNHDFNIGDTEFILETARTLQASFNGKAIYFMPFLEHTQTESFMLNLFSKIEKIAPSLTLVNNPANYSGRTGFYIPNYINEIHYGARPNGKQPPMYMIIACFDGVDAFDADFETWWLKHEGAHMRSFWISEFNQRDNTNDVTPRPKRTTKPNQKHFKALEFRVKNREGSIDFKKPELYKSNSDRHGTNPRSDTPNFVMTTNGKQIVVKDVKGKKVFSAQNVGQYHTEKRWVFRPPTYKWAFEYAIELIKKYGSATCKVYLDGKYAGKIHIAYRAGIEK